MEGFSPKPNDPEAVASPWAAGCGSIAVWPLHYLARGQHRAVIGGWDPSARKFHKTDELSFTVLFGMFSKMLDHYPESFLATKTRATVQKKILRSQKARELTTLRWHQSMAVDIEEIVWAR